MKAILPSKALSLILFLVLSLDCAAKTFSWVPPTQRIDGTALSANEIRDYVLNYREIGAVAWITLRTTSTIVVIDLPSAAYEARVLCTDKNGLRSAWAKMTTVAAVPSPPINALVIL
jgi:hypothetical protein